MNKRPSLQFYPGDWWRASDIKGCSMSTQGVWFNLLMAMWDSPEQGKISGSEEALRRIIGANIKEFSIFLSENKSRKFCNVTFCNKIVTIKNRRMYKDYIERQATKKRVSQHREKVKRKCNKEVTPYSSTSTSINTKDVTLSLQFDEARKLFKGTKRGLQTEYDNFRKKHKNWREVLPLLLPAVQYQIKQRAIDGFFWKNFQTWINNSSWEEKKGQEKTPEQKAQAEQQALEKKRQAIRAEYGQFYREQETDILQGYLVDKQHITHIWLIAEILKERNQPENNSNGKEARNRQG